ncbi:MAG: LysE family translocator [Bauldia sp.]
MPVETLLALTAYAFVAAITPGPNNMMLLASGISFGIARTLPHMAGVVLGFGAMVLAVGLGIGAVFSLVPQLAAVLRIAGTLYLLWLAWQIARGSAAGGGSGGEGKAPRRPMSFLGAAAFQWVNPKGWTMLIGAISAFAPAPARPESIAVMALVFAAVCVPAVLAWTAFGTALRALLAGSGAARWLNYAMAAVLCASTIPAVVEIVGR